MEIPLFPLHTVLCPGIVLPLHIFEERYRTMVARCLASAGSFGVVLIRQGAEVGTTGTLAISSVGTIAEIREASRYSDGRYDLQCVGAGRFRIDDAAVGEDGYLIGQVTPIPEVVGDDDVARQLMSEVTTRFV